MATIQASLRAEEVRLPKRPKPSCVATARKISPRVAAVFFDQRSLN